MKKTIIQSCGIAILLIGFSHVAGNLIGADQSDASAATTTPTIAQPAAAPVGDSSQPGIPLAESAFGPNVNLSNGAAEIAKLAQGGLGEQVMMAFVDAENSKFNLGSDQILYLNDLGVPTPVVQAMIQRDASLESAAQQAAASFTNAQPPPDMAQPSSDQANDPSSFYPTPEQLMADDSPDQAPEDADYFYNSLSPYGSWGYVNGLGLCWQPTLCLANSEWRPYGDRGRWLSSDCGWYWQSDYSWGWAPFHYGRWFNDANRGWVWAPGHVWSPAWVSWRHSAEYAGWAPLPPAARFNPGTGFQYGNRAVAQNFEFGLRAQHYTFIPLARMTDYAPARYAVGASQASGVYNQTAVVSHFVVQNHQVVVQGIDPNEVSAQAGTTVRRAQVWEVPHNIQTRVQTDRLTESGRQLVIVRPHLPAPVAAHPSNPILVAANNSQTFAAARTFGSPGASISRPIFNQPLYYSGHTPYAPEAYPSGSLVVIGDRNNTVAARGLPNMNLSHGGGANPYRVYGTSPNAVQETRAQPVQPAYNVPARYSAAERMGGVAPRTGMTTAQPGAGFSGGRSEAQFHNPVSEEHVSPEARPEYHAPAPEHVSSGSSSGSRTSGSSSSSGSHSSSGSSSSGHK